MAKTKSTQGETWNTPGMAEVIEDTTRLAFELATNDSDTQNQTAEHTVEEQRKAPTESSDAFSVYIGPGILGLIQHGMIISAGDTAANSAISRACAEYPFIGRLLVSGERLAEARAKIKIPGNVLYEHNKALERSIKAKSGG